MMAFWKTIKFLCLFIGISTPVHGSSCTFIDQAQIVTIASSFLSCLDINQDELTDLIDSILALQDLDLGDFVADIQACAAIECDDGGRLCFEVVDCVNNVIIEYNLLDISVTLSDTVTNVVLNYCSCYDELEGINPACYDYIDGLAGFHVPIAEAIEYGDEYCGSFSDMCGVVETFLDECVDVEPVGVSALCDQYVLALVDEDSSLQTCAAEVMAVSLLPPFAMDILFDECTDSLTNEDIKLLNAITNSSQCDFDIVAWSPTAIPTVGPTAIDAVSIDLQFSFQVSSSLTSNLVASVKTVLATQLGISEGDIRNLKVYSGARRQLLSIVYTASCVLLPSLSATGAASQGSLATSYESDISSSSFEVALSSELGTEVVVTETSVMPNTSPPVPSPTSVPNVNTSPSSKDDSASNDAVVGASVSISIVCLVVFVLLGGYFYMKKKGIKFLAMSDEEDTTADAENDDRNSVEMRNSTVTKAYNQISNPVNDQEEKEEEKDSVGNAAEEVPVAVSFESVGESAWL